MTLTLKERIQKDRTIAMKNKDDISKNVLGLILTEISKKEKEENNGNLPLDDKAVMLILAASIKQRKISIAEFEKGGRQDLSTKETDELKVVQAYLPEQYSEEQIRSILTKKISSENLTNLPDKSRRGKLIGFMNKEHAGNFDPALMQEIVNSL
jgi:hypothetical protein